MNQLIYKFLELNYPVLRVKINMRFKRCIILEDGETYQLSDESHRKQLYARLVKIIYLVFHCDESISKDILRNFLLL